MLLNDGVAFTDTHVHFWDLRNKGLTYDWIATPDGNEILGDYGAMKSLRYWADDFLSETRFTNVTRAVHVQAALGTPSPIAVEETRWLQAFADRLGTPNGIVAYVDLKRPDAASLIARHATFANLRGIRDLRFDNYLADPDWQSGYSELARFDLVCCDAPPVDAADSAAELARRFPLITYCVDHAGFPRRRDRDYFKTWTRAMRKIAKVPNTVVKISGLGMCDPAWTVESIRPWILECVDAWGVDRSFFGTNWPLDRLFSSYGDVVDAYYDVITEFKPAEREALFFGNANRVFRLE